jgi:TRAP-type C4-dicarboxylate transport system permease small subunit
MRKILNGCYTACGVVSGLALVGIVVFVLIQIVARPLGLVVSWSAEFAGYAMAASSFMGLAYTLNTGGHIRVNLLADRLPTSWQRWLERLCLLMASGIVGFFAWYCVAMTYDSYQFNEMGQGIIAVPLWMPQLWMALGVACLWLALVDNLITHLMNETTQYPRDGTQPSPT